MYYGPLWFELIRFYSLEFAFAGNQAYALAQCVMFHVCSNPTSQVSELTPLIDSHGAD